MTSPRTVVTVATLAAVLLACSPHDPGSTGNKVPITTTSKQARSAYLEGRSLLERRRLLEAHASFARAVELDPGFGLAYCGLAYTAPTNADLFAASRQAAACVDHVSAGEAHMIRAVAALAAARPEEQERELVALAGAFPEDERVQYLLGAFHYGRQEWPEAIDRLERATRIDPSFAPAYNLLGYCLRNLQRYGEAARALAEYTRLIPDEPNPYDSYGELLMKMGRFADSIAQYRKALDLDPNFSPSYIGLGNDLVLLGRYQEARNAFTTLSFIARDDGDRRNALTWTAISYLHEGNVDAALGEVLRCAELARAAGDDATLANELATMAVILVEDGRGDAALQRFDEALAAAERADVSEEIKAIFRRGKLYIEARRAMICGDLVTAATTAERFRQSVQTVRDPTQLRRSHELLGRVALALDDYDTAVTELRRANRQDPTVLFLEAKALHGAGRLGEAREVCARAADFNGLSLSYAFVRADAHRLLAALERATPPHDPAPAHPAG